jgi:hypothetical protein
MKKYIVELTSEERSALEDIIKAERIVDSVSKSTIHNTLKKMSLSLT